MSAFRTAAITDEFSPDDLDAALDGMAAVGMTGAELRVVGRRNMIDLSNEEVDGVRAAVEAKGMEVISLASPLLKCVLPGSPPLDSRVQHDVFGSPHTFEDQPRADQARVRDRRAARAPASSGCSPTGGPPSPSSATRSCGEALLALADEAAAPRRHHRPRERACVQRRHRRRGGAVPRRRSITPRCSCSGIRRMRRSSARRRFPTATTRCRRTASATSTRRTASSRTTSRCGARWERWGSTGGVRSTRCAATATAAGSASRPTGPGRTATSSKPARSADGT